MDPAIAKRTSGEATIRVVCALDINGKSSPWNGKVLHLVYIITEDNIDWLCDEGCAFARRGVHRGFLSRPRTGGAVNRSLLALGQWLGTGVGVVALLRSLYYNATDKARRKICD